MSNEVCQLDLAGLRCPMPILKTKQKLQSLPKGAQLRVIATDPHAEIDFKAYLARSEHKLISFNDYDERFEFLIEKG